MLGPRGFAAFAALIGALSVLLFGPLLQAVASPAEVRVRIEGRTQTLFEGPILSEGHRVKAASDRQWRHCDSTNNGMNPAPGPTPTAASDDAMRLLGLDFDGQWYPGFDDYFIQRWGPDMESVDGYRYWGILVNGTFTQVGGCQLLLKPGDEAFWAYDAFNNRRFLRLSAQKSDNSVVNPAMPLSPVPVVYVSPGEPFRLIVESYTGGMAGAQAPRPEPGLQISSVQTDPTNYFQTLAAPVGTPSDAGGEVLLTDLAQGWHRFKVADEASFVRSNRIDVCVGECLTLPPDAAVRVPPPLAPIETPGQPQPTGRQPGGGDERPSGPAPRLKRPSIVTGPNRRGQVGVSWKVQQAGVGVRSWLIESRVLGHRGAKWVRRARGGPGLASAAFRLPAGRSHALRFTVIDNAGRAATIPVGQVPVPIDESARQVRLSGPWRQMRDRGAWLGRVLRGESGTVNRTGSGVPGPNAGAAVRLTAGRPVALLRGVRHPARVALISGGRRQVFAIAPRRGTATRQLVGSKRARAGIVRLVVLRGSVGLDGFLTRP